MILCANEKLQFKRWAAIGVYVTLKTTRHSLLDRKKVLWQDLSCGNISDSRKHIIQSYSLT